jgi:hypothetical protein
MPARRSATGSGDAAASGPRPSANGATARPHCRGIPRPPGGCGLPGDLFGRRLQKLRRLRPCSGHCNRLPGPRRLAPGREGHRRARRARRPKLAFRDTARWPKSSPPRQKPPDAFTLQISGSGGSRRQNQSQHPMPTIPRSAARPAGFLRSWAGVSSGDLSCEERVRPRSPELSPPSGAALMATGTRNTRPGPALWTRTCCNSQTRVAQRSFPDDDHRFPGPRV